MVVVLIDEVESLAGTRTAGSGEPSDSLRAVNAILTGLDRLKRHPNCLVVTTSNMMNEGGIDPAFLSRCDVKIYVGGMGEEGRYGILREGIEEMERVGVVASSEAIPEFEASKAAESTLFRLARETEGAEGRELRKVAMLGMVEGGGRIGIEYKDFIELMRQGWKARGESGA